MHLERLARALQRIIPDPFAIAIGLTLVAFGASLLLGGSGPSALLDAWVGGYLPPGATGKPIGGLSSLLGFAMQMCLILVTGFVVANTRPVQAALRALAALPGSTAQAVVLVSLVAMGLALVHWGLGLVGGALLAREVGMHMQERGARVHYPLLAAAGYTGLAVWHGGLSGSAPLKVTDAANLTDVLGGELAGRVAAIPLTHTVLSMRNLLTTGAVLVVIPLVLTRMVPSDPANFVPAPTRAESSSSRQSWLRSDTPGLAGLLEGGPWLSLALTGLLLAWLLPWALSGGLARMNPDHMNLIFLALGLVLAGSPARYMALAREAAGACAGIIVQFPLYGGILGVLAAGGFVGLLADWLPTSEWGLALSTFLSAGLVNLFVPSGGGQWAVQGPIVMQAAAQHGLDTSRIVLALSWGDQWTNLFQPFWALPLLGITGTKAGDILGYTFVLGAVVGGLFALGAVLG